MRTTTTTFSKVGMALVFALASASSASADGSVANTNCIQLTLPLFTESIGNDEEHPYVEEAIQITSQDVDTVNFSVSQVWMDAGTPMVAVQYQDVDEDGAVAWTCNMNAPQEKIAFDSTQEYTAQCIHGYAQVMVFVYVGLDNGFDIDEYEACTATSDDYVGHAVALPCVPVCDPQTPPCFDGPTVSLADIEHESSCLYDETPIMTETTGLKENSVEFTIKNTWPTDAVAALSIHFINADGEVQCDTFEDMNGFESTSAIEALCVNGLAEVGIQIYSTGINFISSIKPEECNAPDAMGHCSYEFVIPCMDGEVCTDDTPSPSSTPTSTLSSFPTREVVDVVPQCVELSQPIINEIAGNDSVYTSVDEFEISPVTITSQNVDDVSIKVTQVFNSNGIPMMAVGYRGSESSELECEMEAPQVDYNFEMEITAQCDMGYAEISLYLYVGSSNDFDAEECEACSLPNEEDYVAFYLIVPCIPVCKPETPDCFDGPMVILADIESESVCLYEDMPIVVNEELSYEEFMNPDNVEFYIQNTWPTNSDISTISVSYKEKESGQLQCETFDFNDDATFIQASCEDGMATVIVEVHSTNINYQADQLSPNSCATPTVGTCAYEMVIPCDPMLECGATARPTNTPTMLSSSSPTGSPTASPSSTPTASPSSGPTASPTASPSSGPTVSPTASPTASPSASPSDSPSGSYFPSSAPTDSPTKSPAPSSSPSASPSTAPTSGPTENPTNEPTDEPSASPSSSPTYGPTDIEVCLPSDPILISNDGDTMYPYSPLTITFQNTTHVAFKVENTFSNTVSSIYTEYHKIGSFGQTECLEEENVEKNSQVETEFVAQCMHNSKISVVNVWMTDCSDATSFLDETDSAEIPQCCHPGEQCRTVQYTFKLPCVSPCPDEEVSILPVNDASDAGVRRNLHVLAEKMKEDPEPNDEEEHFCVNADYPCGTDTDKVHVCHYSARDGYKTFCVPEPDSDALRFYPKDYCGPCVGGYSTS